MPPKSVRIKLFGAFALTVDGAVRALPKPGQELLARLVAAGDHGVERAGVAIELWPEADEQRAQFYLRRTLTALRAALAEHRDLLRDLGDHHLGLAADAYDCDLVEFEAALRRGSASDLEAASALYSGQVLAGHKSAWVRRRRSELQGRYVEALLRMAEALEEAGDWDAAEVWLARAAAVEPLREDTARRRMRLHFRRGEYAALVRVFRDVRSLLRRELGLQPSQATVDCYRTLLVEARLIASSPAPVPEAAPSHHPLPGVSTPFFGRRTESEGLERALREHRVVTVIGPAGVGKSRLALHVARAAAHRFPGGVLYVGIAAHEPSGQVVERLGAAVQGRPTEQALLPTLLVLDGAEGVGPACAAALGPLLSQEPNLSVLCTATFPLQVREEHLFPLSPLPLTGSEGAVPFFLQCARRAAGSIKWKPEDEATVDEIVRRLDGLPLALELAAARCRTMPIGSIRDNLGNRFALLAPPTGPGDSRSLEAAIAWSVELLPSAEAELFQRLSVFPAHWTIEEAAAVCSSGLAPADTLPMLVGSLSERSLVVFESDEGRYRMLETVRSFASSRFRQDPEAWEEVRARHAEHFLAAAQRGEVSDPANFLAAIDWFLGRSEPTKSLALRLVNRMFPAWYRSGAVSLGLATALRAIEACPDASEPLVEALIHAGGAAHRLFRIELANQLFAQAEGLADELGLDAWGTESMRGRGELAANEGRYDESRRLLGQALARYRAVEDRRGEAGCLAMLGYVARECDELSEARRLTEQALATYTAVGDTEGRLWCLGSLAAIHLAAAAPELAVPVLEQTLVLQEAAGNLPGQAWNLTMLGVALRSLGRQAEAESRLRQAMAIHDADEDDPILTWVLSELGELQRTEGRTAEAEATLSRALNLARVGASPIMEVRILTRLGHLAADRGDVDSARAYRAAAEAALGTLEVPQPIGELAELGSRVQ